MCKVQTNQIPSGQIQQVGNEWEHNKLPRFIASIFFWKGNCFNPAVGSSHFLPNPAACHRKQLLQSLVALKGDRWTNSAKIGHLKIVRFWSVVTVVKYHDLISISIYHVWYAIYDRHIPLIFIFTYSGHFRNPAPLGMSKNLVNNGTKYLSLNWWVSPGFLVAINHDKDTWDTYQQVQDFCFKSHIKHLNQINHINHIMGIFTISTRFFWLSS